MEHLIVLNGNIKFDGDCENTRAFCGAVCCKNQVVLLTAEESASGDYDTVSPTDGCDCSACQLMRSTGKAALLRRDGHGCTYLDGLSQCTIYETRPQSCRDFDCKSTWWDLSLHRPKR